MFSAPIAHIEAQGTSAAVTSAAINTIGATLLTIVLASYEQVAEPSITDSLGNTWLPLTAYDEPTCRVHIFYCPSPIVGANHTFSASSGTSTFPAIAVAAWSGSAASPFDVQSGFATAGNVTSVQPGSVTPSANGDLLLLGLNYNPSSGTAPTINDSFALIGWRNGVTNNSFGIAHGYLIQPTAEAINPTISWTTASDCAVALAAFRAVPVVPDLLNQPAIVRPRPTWTAFDMQSPPIIQVTTQPTIVDSMFVRSPRGQRGIPPALLSFGALPPPVPLTPSSGRGRLIGSPIVNDSRLIQSVRTER